MLLIDAGNTRLKWAVAADAPAVDGATCSANHAATAAALVTATAAPGEWLAHGVAHYDDLAASLPHWQGQMTAWVSNVAGESTWQAITRVLDHAGITDIRRFRSSASCGGVSNGYRDPTQLGSDRFASLLGARHRHPSQALLVVTCGTATTIDALDSHGRFIGGMILPGLLTMAKSLVVNTAQLPEVSEVAIPRQFADNTQDAIVSGCVSAQAATIADALRVLRETEPTARCLLSGGAASYIELALLPRLPRSTPAAQITPVFERIDNLVLLGLHVAALENG